jgi:hypothetical protein
VKGLGLEQTVTEAAIQKTDEERIEKYCGGKYARGNGKNRYQRAGSVERHPVTSVGKLNLKLHRIKDKEGGEEERRIFLPVEDRINRRVIEYGEKIKAFNGDEMKDASLEVAYADGTKTHSQEKGKSKNGVNVVLGVSNGKKVLLDARVNKPWEETASKLDEAAALDKKAVIVGDADREMRNALVKGEKSLQLDLIHVFRDTGFKL